MAAVKKPSILAAESKEVNEIIPAAIHHANWGVHYRSPVLMATFSLAGIAFAVCHHGYYQSLDNTVAGSPSRQEWAIRIGTGLALSSKASFAAAIGIAFTQYLWVTIRAKHTSLAALDAMFDLPSDPTSFFTMEIFSGAKTLTLLAGVLWLVPLITAVTPGTLSIRTGMTQNSTSALIPVTNFTKSFYAWYSSYGAENDEIFYIESIAPSLIRLLSEAASSMKTVAPNPPFPNCSYNLEFFGPALSCSNLSDLSSDPSNPFQFAWDNTFNNSASPYFFQSVSPESLGDYVFIQSLSTWGQRNISCNLWNASYNTKFSYSNGAQQVTIQNLTLLSPAAYDDDTPDYLLPSVETYAYQTMFEAMKIILLASLGYSTTGIIGISSPILGTGLAACPEIANGISDATLAGKDIGVGFGLAPWMRRNGSLERAIEDLFHNFTLSLLSAPYYSDSVMTDVEVFTAKNFYSYNSRTLLIAYLVGGIVTLLGLGLGCRGYYINGYSASTSFSTILFTTRNPDLDRLAVGQCLGSQPLQKGFEGTKLRFGVVPWSFKDGYSHASFGVEGTTTLLKKGEQCS